MAGRYWKRLVREVGEYMGTKRGVGLQIGENVRVLNHPIYVERCDSYISFCLSMVGPFSEGLGRVMSESDVA